MFDYPFTFSFMQVLVPAVFILFLAGFIILLVIQIRKKNRDENTPILNVPARLIKKYEKIRQEQQPLAGDYSGGHGFSTVPVTDYYLVFDAESGEKMAFTVEAEEYARLEIGNRGMLYYQGSRYQRFELNT